MSQNRDEKPKLDSTEVALTVSEDPEHQEKIDSYVIGAADKNTEVNPDREATITLPHLVKRVDSRELIPKPFTHFNQLLFFSYISILFCPFFGAIGNMYAWKAKSQRSKGVYTSAKRRARLALYWSLGSIASGFAILIIVLATNYKEL